MPWVVLLPSVANVPLNCLFLQTPKIEGDCKPAKIFLRLFLNPYLNCIWCLGVNTNNNDK